MKLYEQFRGHKPETKALIEKMGARENNPPGASFIRKENPTGFSFLFVSKCPELIIFLRFFCIFVPGTENYFTTRL